MRTVNLIQFTEEHSADSGYYPEVNRIYSVIDLDDEYYYEVEDDEGDTYEENIPSISIRDGGRKRHVTETNHISYNLITIELEDDSELFAHRR